MKTVTQYDLSNTYGYTIGRQVYYDGIITNALKYSIHEGWMTEVPFEEKELKIHSILQHYRNIENRHIVVGWYNLNTLFMVEHENKYIYLYVSSNKEKNIEEAKTYFRNKFVKLEIKEQQKVPVEFWYNTIEGPKSNVRNLDVPRWDEIPTNYASSIRPGLNSLMEATEPHGGKLVLWSGAPGTGKTYALRALAWEWRKWCSFHYLTEPEAFFGREIGGLMQVILKEDQDKWKLLVLEDTGEMLVADAKQRVGQNLSRLLNIMDGLLGQGLKVMALITTNEEMGTLHPAILRPGRCWTHINFEPLSTLEANAWLAAHDSKKTVNQATYLADLYGELNQWTKKSENKQRVGFI